MDTDLNVQTCAVYVRGDPDAYVACIAPEKLLYEIERAMRDVACGDARLPWVRFPSFKGETTVRADEIVAIHRHPEDDDEDDDYEEDDD